MMAFFVVSQFKNDAFTSCHAGPVEAFDGIISLIQPAFHGSPKNRNRQADNFFN